MPFPAASKVFAVLSIASISTFTAYARDRSMHEANEAHPGIIGGCVLVCSRLCDVIAIMV
jgi:hypothetical protein